MSVAGFSLVVYAPSSSNGHIMVMQVPASAGLDQAAMERQLRQSTQHLTYNQYVRVRTVGQKMATIRGQEVMLTISEGLDSEGQTYREVFGLFHGKGGPTFLMIAAPIKDWDQSAIEAFIASIS